MRNWLKLFSKITILQLLLIIILLSAALRFGFGYSYLHNADLKSTKVWVDDWAYIDYSKAIFNGIFLHTNLDASESAQYRLDVAPPLYPIILSIYYGIVGYSHLKMIVFLNILVNILNVILLFLIGKRLFKGKLALVPPFLWAIYYNSLILSGRALKEPFITLFILIISYLILKLWQSFRYRDLLYLSIMNVLIAHLDERYLFMTALSFVFLTIILFNQKIHDHIWRGLLLYILICATLFFPWMNRNYKRYDKIVFITTRTSKITDQIFGYKSNSKAIEDLNSIVSPAQIDSILYGYKLTTVDSITQASILNAHEQGLKPYQYNIGERLYFNMIGFWQVFSVKPIFVGTGYKIVPYWGIRTNALIILEFGIFIPFAIYAFYLGFKRKNLILLFFFSILFINTVQHVLLNAGLNRYRSVMDPLIYLAACFAIEHFYYKKKSEVQVFSNND
jgi:hypothetical protein